MSIYRLSDRNKVVNDRKQDRENDKQIVSNDQTRRDRAGEESRQVKMITCNKDTRVRGSKTLTADFPLKKRR